MNSSDLFEDTDVGRYRIRGHRIGLEDIIFYHREGYSPEMIVGQFPTLPLSTVYQVIGYYLEHRDELDAYIEREQQIVEKQREASSPGPDLEELRRRLAKRQQLEAS